MLSTAFAHRVREHGSASIPPHRMQSPAQLLLLTLTLHHTACRLTLSFCDSLRCEAFIAPAGSWSQVISASLRRLHISPMDPLLGSRGDGVAVDSDPHASAEPFTFFAFVDERWIPFPPVYHELALLALLAQSSPLLSECSEVQSGLVLRSTWPLLLFLDCLDCLDCEERRPSFSVDRSLDEFLRLSSRLRLCAPLPVLPPCLPPP